MNSDTQIDRPYELTVTRDFVAQHFLTVPDPGPEGEEHSHGFTVEVRFAGPSLGEYGYLVDIDEVNAVLDDQTPTHLTVRIWEDDSAWASHERTLYE